MMNTNDLLRKLAPLIPREVARWRRSLPFVNDDTRRLLERHIVHRAQDLLGIDAGSRLLLVPPPRKLSKGDVALGTVVYDQDKWPFALTLNEVLQHVGVFGRSGSGKTNLVFLMLKELERQGIPWTFFDWKRTARHLIPHFKTPPYLYTPGRSLSPLRFNPYRPPPGIEPHQYATNVIDLIASAYTLGDGAKSILYNAFSATYQRTRNPSTADLLESVDEQDTKGRALGWQVSARRALQSLDFARILSSVPEADDNDLARFWERNTIIELNGLHENAKKFLIPTLLLWLYHLRLGAPDRERLRLAVILEEAHHILRRQAQSRESVMERLLRMAREVGMGMIVVDQHPSLISQAALGNTYASICLNLKDPADMNRAAALSLLRDDDKPHLSRLPVGYGVVKLQDRWHHPFLIKIPHVPVEKGLLTDNRVQAALAARGSRSGRNRSLSRGFERVRRVRFADMPLSTHAFAFIEDVLQHPHDGVRQRYQRLGVSVEKGGRLRHDLVSAGVLEQQQVQVRNTRKLMLRVTANARARLGVGKPANVTRESIAHEYWKHHYATCVEDMGYKVAVEAPRPTRGRADVLASAPSGEKIAIEIETGKSNVAENVRQSLASKWERVLVVATSHQVLTKIELLLGRGGLLIPDRVRLMCAGEQPEIVLPRDST